MKVGIVQNKIIYGGRLSVIVGIIEVLNHRGIVPDVITFQTETSPKGISRRYGHQINFKLRRINSVLSKVPGEANILAFNLALHRIYREYDYLINSNNTSFMMPSHVPLFSYIHFPRIARLKSPYMSIHVPDGPLKKWCNRQGAIFKLLGILYTFHRVMPQNYIVTNSKFSRRHFQHYYPDYNRHIPVVYPPVKTTGDPIPSLNSRANMICSIGRFCEDKNQLAQIRLAERLPDWNFRLVGFADKPSTYLNDCQRYVGEREINNVDFEVNVSLTKKRDLLQSAKFFIHPNINEPFGISTTESILNGCLPLVHDSGGQREIVPFKELRFNTLDEIPKMLEQFSISSGHLNRLQKKLIDLCRDRFDFQVFKANMQNQLDRFESAYLK